MMKTAGSLILAAGAAMVLAGCDFELPRYDGGKAAEADQVGEVHQAPSAAAGTYLGESMNARKRAQETLGGANAIRREQINEERAFDSPRRQ